MFETVLGTALGGAFRLLPEVLKLIDRRGERKHEKDMVALNIEADKLKNAAELARIEAQRAATVDTADLQALIGAVAGQSAKTGVPFADAVSALVRPVLTFWWGIVLYSAALWFQFTTLKAQGLATQAAFLQIWGPDEKAIVASIFAFWFVDRSLRKSRGFMR